MLLHLDLCMFPTLAQLCNVYRCCQPSTKTPPSVAFIPYLHWMAPEYLHIHTSSFVRKAQLKNSTCGSYVVLSCTDIYPGSRCVQSWDGVVGDLEWRGAMGRAVWPRLLPDTGGGEEESATERGTQRHCSTSPEDPLPTSSTQTLCQTGPPKAHIKSEAF